MKKWLIPMILMALLCLVTSCACDTTENNMTPSAAPTASNAPDAGSNTGSSMPENLMPGTGIPSDAGTTLNTTKGVTTADRARMAVEKIEEELSRMSEVDGAQVLVAGTTAVVALDFDTLYQSGVTDRIEKMVKERIDAVVTGIENVIVTDDTTVAKTLEKLGERLDGAADMTELEAELQKLIGSIREMA